MILSRSIYSNLIQLSIYAVSTIFNGKMISFTYQITNPEKLVCIPDRQVSQSGLMGKFCDRGKNRRIRVHIDVYHYFVRITMHLFVGTDAISKHCTLCKFLLYERTLSEQPIVDRSKDLILGR